MSRTGEYAYENGYTKKEAIKDIINPNDYIQAEGGAMYSKCCDITGGFRCNNPGTMSHATRGEGKWYCSRHFLNK